MPTAKRKAKKKIWAQAKGLYLNKFISENNKCHYCNINVYRARKILRHRPKLKCEMLPFHVKIYQIYDDRCGLFPIATIDHIQKVSSGGGNNKDNVVLCCAECNNMRERLGDKSFGEWLDRKQNRSRINCVG